ncbi:hypothetical protein MHYP_G00171580 [Metynnis hypsauchen]
MNEVVFVTARKFPDITKLLCQKAKARIPGQPTSSDGGTSAALAVEGLEQRLQPLNTPADPLVKDGFGQSGASRALRPGEGERESRSDQPTSSCGCVCVVSSGPAAWTRACPQPAC